MRKRDQSEVSSTREWGGVSTPQLPRGAEECRKLHQWGPRPTTFWHILSLKEYLVTRNDIFDDSAKS